LLALLADGWSASETTGAAAACRKDRGDLLAAFIAKMIKAQFEARHVFFQKEDADTYIGKILTKIAASVIAATVSP
jgi:hypothetical protein